jgi:PIN domain nuclease of toxin-antitoxin system
VAPVILLDTHVVAWLYAGQVERLSAKARELVEIEDLCVSPTVALELQYLHEIGRLGQPPDPVLTELGRTLGLRSVDASLGAVTTEAVGLSWTRDPFDRLLAAHAIVRAAPLLTADATIQANLANAVWN